MKQVIKFLMIIIIAYLIYSFLLSMIIYKNSSLKEKSEPFPQDSKENKGNNRDRVRLIESEQNGVWVRINLIENAEKSIDISYYTFRNGKVAKMMLGSILDAANRGVKVRILIDSLSFLPSLAGEMKNIVYGLDSHDNIDWKFYHPINPLFPFNWNKRLHDKMIIVDESLALIGGRNIADNYYMGNTKWRSFSKDRDVLIFKDKRLGDYHSVIGDMQDYYNQTWDYKYSRPLKKTLSPKEKIKNDLACSELQLEYVGIKDDIKDKLDKTKGYSDTIAVENISFVHNSVGKFNHNPRCLKQILYLSSKAKESIFIQSPYIIPSRRVKKDFTRHDIDLEKTTILTNSYYSSPNYLSISAYSNYRKQMLDKQVRIYEYQGQGSLHAKTYVFDDCISVIGSFNLDSRSSYINSETMIVIKSKEFAKELNNNIMVDLRKSLKVGKDDYYIKNEKVGQGENSKIKRITIRILSKIAPIFEHLL